VTHVVSPPIAVGDTPWGVTITPNGALAVIANVNSDTVSIIDLASGVVTHTLTLPVGTSPNWVDITADGTTAFVTNYLTNSLSVIDLATFTIGTPIAVGNNPHYVKITPDGRTIYTPNDDGTVSVLVFPAVAPAATLAETGQDAARANVLAEGGSALVLLGLVIVLARRRLDELQD
jgi:YVTN family beta-propeller protein